MGIGDGMVGLPVTASAPVERGDAARNRALLLHRRPTLDRANAGPKR